MYLPVIQLDYTDKQWMVGKIENHQARALYYPEVYKVCEILNSKLTESKDTMHYTPQDTPEKQKIADSGKGLLAFFDRRKDRKEISYGQLSPGDRQEWIRRYHEYIRDTPMSELIILDS